MECAAKIVKFWNPRSNSIGILFIPNRPKWVNIKFYVNIVKGFYWSHMKAGF